MSSQNLAAKSEVSEASGMAGIKKDLYEIGEIPPLGHVPKNMYAWTIRKERQGREDLNQEEIGNTLYLMRNRK